MKNPQAIIFDMDGLLVDSETIWEVAETQLIESRGRRYDKALRDQFIGMRMDEFFIGLRDAFQLEDSIESLTAELMRIMLDLIPTRVLPMPGVAELLDYVVTNRIPCAIASSSPSEIIESVVSSRGWVDVFPLRVTADSVARGKPAPDVYLEAARQLGVVPQACLALEDSPNGARAAVAAGMVCYAVPDKRHIRAEAFYGITDHIFSSLHDVLAELKSEH
ncbi:MAG: HAD family phosphatase [Anaerolineae bacterium]|nr:HAD family phosphatase [Anaerolineae bacterium]